MKFTQLLILTSTLAASVSSIGLGSEMAGTQCNGSSNEAETYQLVKSWNDALYQDKTDQIYRKACELTNTDWNDLNSCIAKDLDDFGHLYYCI